MNTSRRCWSTATSARPAKPGGARHERPSRIFLSVAAVARFRHAAASPHREPQAPAAGDPRALQDPASPSCISMLPKGLAIRGAVCAARTAGFEAIEMQTIARGRGEAAEIREAATKTGLGDPFGDELRPLAFPLSSARPRMSSTSSVNGMETSLRNAEAVGRRHRAAGAGRRRREDLLPRRLDAVAARHPRAAAAAGQRAEGRSSRSRRSGTSSS